MNAPSSCRVIDGQDVDQPYEPPPLDQGCFSLSRNLYTAISVSSNSLCVLASHGLLLSYPLPMTSKSSNRSSCSSLGSNLTITFPSCFSLGSNVTPLLEPIFTPSLVSWTWGSACRRGCI